MEMLLNETERLMIGLNADKATERIYFDMNMKGKANSEMEKKLTTAKKAGPSQFLGFLMDKAG